jgi:hypothetical protein
MSGCLLTTSGCLLTTSGCFNKRSHFKVHFSSINDLKMFIAVSAYRCLILNMCMCITMSNSVRFFLPGDTKTAWILNSGLEVSLVDCGSLMKWRMQLAYCSHYTAALGLSALESLNIHALHILSCRDH